MLLSLAALGIGQAAALYTDNATGIIAPCNSGIFCYGSLLRDIQLAAPFEDSKTFVDLPTIRPVSEVLAAYQNLSKPVTNDTALQNFLTTNFGDVGLEIGAVNSTLTTDPTFLNNVNNSVLADFVRQVVNIWPDLTRQVVPSALCDGCESTFIPPARPFVVAGGRFREVYYWDSFFILEGLLRTKGNYTTIAKNTIENFLDFVEEYGFMPNGARTYYLNRSQPPFLANMIQVYIQNTNDTSLLERAIPLLLVEQQYFENQAYSYNGTMGNNSILYRYNVQNNQPRPESYLEDYETVNNMTYYAMNGSTFSVQAIDNSSKADLYRDLATGAETGWDYSSRWLRDASDAARDTGIPLRTLNTANIIPIELQSLQVSNAKLIGHFYALQGNRTAAAAWTKVADARAEVLETFHYNESLNAYFDYNLTSGRQNTMAQIFGGNQSVQQFFSPAQFFPLAFGASQGKFDADYQAILNLYEPVVQHLEQYPGGIGATNTVTGQQWDEPNVWPPLQYVLIRGLLESVPDSRVATGDPGYEQVQDLALEIAQRYVSSAYCTWRASGGSHPSLGIGQLPGVDPASNGTMFEKYSSLDINTIGAGGEYSTVEGFGWSNGVLIWIADLFGQDLVMPQCEEMSAVARRSLRSRGPYSGLKLQQPRKSRKRSAGRI